MTELLRHLWESYFTSPSKADAQRWAELRPKPIVSRQPERNSYGLAGLIPRGNISQTSAHLQIQSTNVTQAPIEVPPRLNLGLFGRLPIELRLMIYRHLLTSQPAVFLERAPREFSSYFRGKKIRTALFGNITKNFAILRTSRDIYNECIPVVYSGNLFSINNLVVLVHLSECVRPEDLAAIRHLRLDCQIHPQDPRYNMKGTWDQLWDIVATKMHLSSFHLNLVHLGGSTSNRLDVESPWGGADDGG
jgi:hypothetical protein